MQEKPLKTKLQFLEEQAFQVQKIGMSLMKEQHPHGEDVYWTGVGLTDMVSDVIHRLRNAGLRA